MDPHSILDKDNGEGPVPTEPLPREWPGTASAAEGAQGEMRFPGEDGGKSLADMAQRDLTATLQLLAERAQYITGATGAAIALRDRQEMVCRASAGGSAPEVGAQLQVNSGLSGESVRTRQTLRCDDALTDERVNRESCEALGIRSVVVMPLVQGDDVIGVFELFSDKANIFEARDITALERMGGMVHTALEHSSAALGVLPSTQEATSPESAPGIEAVAGVAPTPLVAGNMDFEQAATAAIPEQTGVEEIEIPEVAEPAAPMGRIEALAVAQLGPRSGIAFHRRVAAPASAVAPTGVTPMAAAPAMAAEEASPVPSRPALDLIRENQPAVAEGSGNVVEETEILEMPLAEEPASAGRWETAPTEDVLAEENDPGMPPASVSSALPDAAIRGETGVSPVQAGGDDRRSIPTSAVAGTTVPREEPRAPVVASRGAIANLRKCEACGFPVSEGRQLCLDCEKKKKAPETTPEVKTPASSLPGADSGHIAASTRPAPEAPAGEMPRFFSGEEEETSWLATHKLMVVAMVVAVVGIVVVLLIR
jgi:putative methionine-R-sulfoxide reductase with GAF domain